MLQMGTNWERISLQVGRKDLQIFLQGFAGKSANPCQGFANHLRGFVGRIGKDWERIFFPNLWERIFFPKSGEGPWAGPLGPWAGPGPGPGPKICWSRPGPSKFWALGRAGPGPGPKGLTHAQGKPRYGQGKPRHGQGKFLDTFPKFFQIFSQCIIQYFCEDHGW